MKKLIVVTGLLLTVIQTTFAQDKAKIKAEATISANAFASGDYTTLAAHTFPKVVDKMGGKVAFASMLTNDMATLKKQGVTTERITVGQPGEIYPVGNQLLCVIPETIVVKMQSKYLTTTVPMIAASGDKGKTWYFLDSSNASERKMQSFFPEYRGLPAIPRPTQPVFTDKMPK